MVQFEVVQFEAAPDRPGFSPVAARPDQLERRYTFNYRPGARHDLPEAPGPPEATGLSSLHPSLAVTVYVSVAIGVGALMTVQVGVNTSLARYVKKPDGYPDPVTASLASFLGGTAFLVAVNMWDEGTSMPATCVAALESEVKDVSTSCAWRYTGGALAASAVAASLVSAPVVGFAVFAVFKTVGNLLASLVIDAAGLMEMPQRTPTTRDYGCVLALLGGAALCSHQQVSDQLAAVDHNSLALLFLAVAVGAALSIQAAVNGALSRRIGGPKARATLVSFTVGSLCLLVGVGAGGSLAPLGRAAGAPVWMLTGGLYGAAYVQMTIIVPPRIGLTATFVAQLAGLLASGLAFDAVGAFNFQRSTPTAARVAGVLLAFAATVAMRVQTPPDQEVPTSPVQD